MIHATPTLTVHDGRSLAAAGARFNLIAFHWRGPGRLRYRVRFRDGWSPWRAAGADAADIDWVGTASGYQTRAIGRVTHVRAYTVWSPVEPTLSRRLQLANAPPIIPRLSWGADESIRRAPPQYAPSLRVAFVHHTAGSNNYTPAQSAAIVRGIELYHVEGNGWNDIGYNFVVDKYGQVFEGRYGGVDKNVIGAHTEGFNTGSVGVAVLGDYGSKQITPAAASALEQLLSWRLDVAHVDPLGFLTYASGGNSRFPTGTPVDLRVISGHRDAYFTDCPGNALYAQLPAIARAVAALGGPKIYAPLATTVETQTRFTARLSVAQPWTVTITNSAGQQVAQGTGSGTTVDWTWDAATAPPDTYTWTIAAGGARPATGRLGAVAALALQKVAASPTTIAPGESLTVHYTLTAPAVVTVAFGNASPFTTVPKPAGAQTLVFSPPLGLVNGAYTLTLTATAGGKAVTVSVPFALDDILTALAASATGATFTLARTPTAVSAQLDGVPVSTATQPVAFPPLPDGKHTFALTVTDDVGTFTKSVSFTVDTKPPTITVVSYTNLRFTVSEPATLTLVVGTQRYTRVLKQAKTTQFWLKVKPSAYRLIVTDAAGNTATAHYRR